MTKLKPCPMCFKEVPEYYNPSQACDADGFWFVYCNERCIRGPGRLSKAAAIKAWNTRKKPKTKGKK